MTGEDSQRHAELHDQQIKVKKRHIALALVAFILNIFFGVSVTVMILVAIMIFRGPRILMNLFAARRAARNDDTWEERERQLREQTQQETLELISEQHLPRIVITIYLTVNSFIEMVREIIEFKQPLVCFAKSVSFLGVSAVLTIVGDMNVFWLLLFLSFFGPSLLKSRSSEEEPDSSTNKSEDKEREHTASGLMLTKQGAVVVAKFRALFEQLDSRIPKFSDW